MLSASATDSAGYCQVSRLVLRACASGVAQRRARFAKLQGEGGEKRGGSPSGGDDAHHPAALRYNAPGEELQVLLQVPPRPPEQDPRSA